MIPGEGTPFSYAFGPGHGLAQVFDHGQAVEEDFDRQWRLLQMRQGLEDQKKALRDREIAAHLEAQRGLAPPEFRPADVVGTQFQALNEQLHNRYQEGVHRYFSDPEYMRALSNVRNPHAVTTPDDRRLVGEMMRHFGEIDMERQRLEALDKQFMGDVRAYQDGDIFMNPLASRYAAGAAVDPAEYEPNVVFDDLLDETELIRRMVEHATPVVQREYVGPYGEGYKREYVRTNLDAARSTVLGHLSRNQRAQDAFVRSRGIRTQAEYDAAVEDFAREMLIHKVSEATRAPDAGKQMDVARGAQQMRQAEPTAYDVTMHGREPSDRLWDFPRRLADHFGAGPDPAGQEVVVRMMPRGGDAQRQVVNLPTGAAVFRGMRLERLSGKDGHNVSVAGYAVVPVVEDRYGNALRPATRDELNAGRLPISYRPMQVNMLHETTGARRPVQGAGGSPLQRGQGTEDLPARTEVVYSEITTDHPQANAAIREAADFNMRRRPAQPHAQFYNP